jgi:hypothetical protein
MDWHLAVEKNREALLRVLALLVAMAGLVRTGGDDPAGPIDWRAGGTLPRHLHRLVLRLLRPAEAAARRLIIVAARGLVVEVSPPRPRKPKPLSIFVRNGVGTGIVRVGSLAGRTVATPRAMSLPLFDPLKRFGRRRRVKQRSIPRISFFDGFDRRREPAPPPLTPDDPLDAGRVFRRLEALASALDDLPRQAKRLARWRARRDAANADLPPCGGDVRQDRGGREGTLRYEPIDATGAQSAKASRPIRFSPMRPGRPPGWSRRPNHQVYEVLNDLHGGPTRPDRPGLDLKRPCLSTGRPVRRRRMGARLGEAQERTFDCRGIAYGNICKV